MINVRKKGQLGELEFCRWLKDILDLEDLPQRNLEQVRSGGSDIVDIHPFYFEVKRCQTLSKRDWWIQVKKAVNGNPHLIPVVCYRQNRKKWKFLISAVCVGLDTGFIQLEEIEFTKWLKNYFKII